MKMSNDEIGVVQRNVGPRGTKEKAAEPARYEDRNETKGEEHRRRELDSRIPQTDHPAQNQNRRRYRNQQRGQREDAAEHRIHAADKHVMAPYDETQGHDRDPAAGHDPVTEDRFSDECRENLRRNAHCWNDDDVHLGMSKKPKEELPQQRMTAGVGN